jgi:hypothetical protein
MDNELYALLATRLGDKGDGYLTGYYDGMNDVIKEMAESVSSLSESIDLIAAFMAERSRRRYAESVHISEGE